MSAPVKKIEAEVPDSPKGDQKLKKPTHPPTAKMVKSAIASLNDKNGSSVQAIKKYVVATYLLEPSKANKVISKYLRTAASTGILVQTKGVGASGSFKLPSKTTKIATKKAATKKAIVKRPARKAKASPKKKTVGSVKAIKTAAKPKAKKMESSPVKTTKAPAKKQTTAPERRTRRNAH